jgi:hypothetical protein
MKYEMIIPCDHVIAKLREYDAGDLDEIRSVQCAAISTHAGGARPAG